MSDAKTCIDCTGYFDRAIRGSVCRPCRVVRSTAWIAANRERYNANQRSITARRRARIQAAKNKPCADCGVSYPPYVMDFDHAGDKVANVSEMVAQRASVTAIDAEIAKCEVVCANCHRERTHRRRQEQA